MSGPVLLDAQHIQKYAYDDEGRPIRGTDVLLLADASLELLAGEVHALVGENGAGKTTLIKVIGGALPYEGGSLHVDGQLRGETTISRVRSEGIAVIWQEFSLAPHLSVVENMFLGRELRRGRRLDKGEMRRQAAEAIATLGVSIDLDSTGRTALHLAAAARGDRPGAERALPHPHPRRAHGQPQPLRDGTALRAPGPPACRGPGHPLRDASAGRGVHGLGPRLRPQGRALDGHAADAARRRRTRSSSAWSAVTWTRCTSAIATAPGEVVLETRQLRPAGGAAPVSINLRRGEIVGLAGLVGAGRTELARAIVGADPVVSGEVLLDGVDVTGWPMRRRLDAGHGLRAREPQGPGRHPVACPSCATWPSRSGRASAPGPS